MNNVTQERYIGCIQCLCQVPIRRKNDGFLTRCVQIYNT